MPLNIPSGAASARDIPISKYIVAVRVKMTAHAFDIHHLPEKGGVAVIYLNFHSKGFRFLWFACSYMACY